MFGSLTRNILYYHVGFPRTEAKKADMVLSAVHRANVFAG